MNHPEVILNLWYVRDEEGIIYSLRAKAYVAEGLEEEKLRFLQDRARLDYLIASDRIRLFLNPSALEPRFLNTEH